MLCILDGLIATILGVAWVGATRFCSVILLDHDGHKKPAALYRGAICRYRHKVDLTISQVLLPLSPTRYRWWKQDEFLRADYGISSVECVSTILAPDRHHASITKRRFRSLVRRQDVSSLQSPSYRLPG